MKKQKVLFLLLSGALFFSFAVFYRGFDTSRVTVMKGKQKATATIFPYQCIDTMKVSRDKARLLAQNPNAKILVRSQVQTIASLGANCIAIGTPYDEEFVPILRLWVKEARQAKLKVWFRGNWSEWEGWFDREKKQTTDEHIDQTVAFILSHPDLFTDGDVFSPNVEPENGASFSPVDSEKKTQQLRMYLIKEQLAVKRAFALIKKSVITPWVSMSGGVAKSVLDDKTIAALNYTVTLDHYVKSPKEMTEYITDFSRRFNARLVFGEFGAPIPDINGEMDEKTQAEFVGKLLAELFRQRYRIDGINYWTLSESSTALIQQNGRPKPVVAVIKQYYIPGIVTVFATDKDGKRLPKVSVSTQRSNTQVATDTNGTARLILPQGVYRMSLTTAGGNTVGATFALNGREQVTLTARFTEKTTLFLLFKNFLQRNIPL